jgi:hypothetical protein
MNTVMIMAVLFLPVLLIIFLSIYTQRRKRRKQQELLLLYLREHYASLQNTEPKIYWLANQLLAIFSAAGKLVILKREGPHVDAAPIALKEINSIEFFRETESMKTEGKQQRSDLVVMQMGLIISYKQQKATLLFFDYVTEQSSLLPEKEKQATMIRTDLLKLKETIKNNS